MPTSIREQILAATETRLETILISNGYATDIGGTVERCRRSVDEANLPAISLFDGPETFVKQFGALLVSMQVEVHVFDSTTTPSPVASQVLADVFECFTNWNLKVAPILGKIDSIEYQEGTPEYPEDGSDILKVVSLFLFKYQLVKGDPYTQP